MSPLSQQLIKFQFYIRDFSIEKQENNLIWSHFILESLYLVTQLRCVWTWAQGRFLKTPVVPSHSGKHIVYFSIFASPRWQMSELFAAASPHGHADPWLFAQETPRMSAGHSGKSKWNLRGFSSHCQPVSGCAAQIGSMEADKCSLRPLPIVPCSKCLRWQTAAAGSELAKWFWRLFQCVVPVVALRCTTGR